MTNELLVFAVTVAGSAFLHVVISMASGRW